MTALAVSQDIQTKDKDGGIENEIRNASTIFYGGSLAVGSLSHGTTASRGRLAPFTGALGEIPWGLAKPGGTGGADGFGVDSDGLIGDTAASPIIAASTDGHDGFYLQNVTVAGVAAVTDSVGRRVYLNDTDNPLQDLTLTRPTRGLPWGVVTKYRTGTNCDVRAFSTWEIYLLSLAGAAQYTWHLGTIVAELAAAADLLTGIEAPHHGAITSVYAICASAPADANMHMDIQIEIGGTNLTGGTVTLDFADATAAKKAGTAVTGNNVFHEGDLIDVEALAAAFVAGTDGDGIYNIYAEVQPREGT